MSFHQVDHHFVALVEVEGGVWELDGRRKGGPKLVGNFLALGHNLATYYFQRWASARMVSFWARRLLCARSTCQEIQPA